MHIVALLDTMWGDRHQAAPRFFRINPNNVSGKRLYRLTEGHTLVVTNSCTTMVTHPNNHGTPDPEWVRNNLASMKFDLLLVCGQVARQTYRKTCCTYPFVYYMDHPAARRWTTERMVTVRNVIQWATYMSAADWNAMANGIDS